VFLKLALAEKAQLEFELNGNNFRLLRVVDNGKWRIGNELGRRSLGVESSSQPRSSCASVKGGNESRTAGKTFPFDDREAILRLAGEYWGLISAEEATEERAFEAEMPAARQQGFLTKPLFVRICRWKSKRQTPRYESNDEASILSATVRAFRTDPPTAISALMQLHTLSIMQFCGERCGKDVLQCPRSSQMQDRKLGPMRPELFLRSFIPIPTIFAGRWKRSISPRGWRQGEQSKSRSLGIFSSAKCPTPASSCFGMSRMLFALSTMSVVTVEPCFARLVTAGYHGVSSAPTTRGRTGSMVRSHPRHTWRRWRASAKATTRLLPSTLRSGMGTYSSTFQAIRFRLKSIWQD